MLKVISKVIACGMFEIKEINLCFAKGIRSKHLKVLKAIFENLVSGSIDFEDIEKLLIALGAEVYEGNGSRVRFVLERIPITMHRPHPQKEAKKYQIKDLRDFLEKLGITP